MNEFFRVRRRKSCPTLVPWTGPATEPSDYASVSRGTEGCVRNLLSRTSSHSNPVYPPLQICGSPTTHISAFVAKLKTICPDHSHRTRQKCPLTTRPVNNIDSFVYDDNPTVHNSPSIGSSLDFLQPRGGPEIEAAHRHPRKPASRTRTTMLVLNEKYTWLPWISVSAPFPIEYPLGLVFIDASSPALSRAEQF